MKCLKGFMEKDYSVYVFVSLLFVLFFRRIKKKLKIIYEIDIKLNTFHW